MGAPPSSAILPGVRPIWVATYGCREHPECVHQSPVNQAPVNQSLVNQSPVILHHNQLHQAPVNQAQGDQAPVNPGNLSPDSQALCYQAPGNQSPVNKSPITHAPGNQSPVIWYQVPVTGYQSPVIQAPVIMRDYQGLDTSHRATRHQSPGTRHQSVHQAPVIKQKRLVWTAGRQLDQKSSVHSLLNERQNPRYS